MRSECHVTNAAAELVRRWRATPEAQKLARKQRKSPRADLMSTRRKRRTTWLRHGVLSRRTEESERGRVDNTARDTLARVKRQLANHGNLNQAKLQADAAVDLYAASDARAAVTAARRPVMVSSLSARTRLEVIRPSAVLAEYEKVGRVALIMTQRRVRGRIVNKEGCQPVPIVAYTRVPPSPPLDPGPKLEPTQSVRARAGDHAVTPRLSLWRLSQGERAHSSFVWSRGRGGSSGESARRVLLHVFRGRGSNFGNNKVGVDIQYSRTSHNA
ncbi:hypothetical protein EDB86DRAFT_3246204 [Lactarius hatsudake]|nr:hypothetical protein EDB86DRAFT_3246204 [Lactarius hatsudake]